MVFNIHPVRLFSSRKAKKKRKKSSSPVRSKSVPAESRRRGRQQADAFAKGTVGIVRASVCNPSPGAFPDHGLREFGRCPGRSGRAECRFLILRSPYNEASWSIVVHRPPNPRQAAGQTRLPIQPGQSMKYFSSSMSPFIFSGTDQIGYPRAASSVCSSRVNR